MNAKQMRAILNANVTIDNEATEKAAVLGQLLGDAVTMVGKAYDTVVNSTTHAVNHEDGHLSNFITGYRYQRSVNK